ncbi:MAG: hypothetical protein LBR27_03060 [Bifidobacteriaceae bacterium]|jgi:hypothetical protein|nr:hypothetical protein [Bifidobacteriaceae bacterium]
MTGLVRSVRFAITTLVGPWAVFAALAFEITLMLQRDAVYLGEAMFTLRWMALAFLYLGPVIAGVAATDAARLMRPGQAELALARRRRRLTWALAWCVLPIVACHVGVFFVAVAIGGDFAPRGGWGRILLALLAQGLAIAWFGCLGSCVGRFLPPLVAGLAAAAIGFGLMLGLNSDGLGTGLFEPLVDSGASLSQIGLLFAIPALLIRISLLAVTGALLLLAPARWDGRLALPGLLGWVLGVAAFSLVVGAALLVPGDKDFVWVGANPDVCEEIGGIEFCYFHEHERGVEPWREQISHLVVSLETNGYGAVLPTRVLEWGRVANQEAVPRQVTIGSIEPGQPPDVATIASWLVYPEWCPQLLEVPSDNFMIDARLMSSSVEALMNGAEETEYFLDGSSITYPLPVEDIEAMYQRWLVCDLD